MSLNLLLLLLSLILSQQQSIVCPTEGTNGNPTDITNNCGMAQWCQPSSKETCTEISLVDGYCCYVETQGHGKACIRQGEIDEDNKNEITDEMRKAVKRLNTNTAAGEPVIIKVECKGYYIAFYGLSLLLLAVML